MSGQQYLPDRDRRLARILEATGCQRVPSPQWNENMIRVGRSWLAFGYWIGLVGAGAIVAAAFLSFPLQSIGDPQILLIPVAVGVLVAVAYRCSPDQRRKILRVVSTVAGLCIGASIVMRLPILSAIYVPVVTPYIPGLDGEAAYDAHLYEAWCEAWVALAILYLGFRYFLRYGRRSARIGTGK
jgi:hypothetical protein